MTSISFGDLASQIQMRRQATGLNRNIATLSDELTTGRRAAPGRALGGDHSVLAGIERAITRNEGLLNVAKMATTRLAVAQSALERIAEPLPGLATEVAMVAAHATDDKIGITRQTLEARFRDTVSSLNANVGGRGVFSGDATTVSALADPDQILAELRLAMAGATTAQDAADAVAAWFAPGGGFDTLGYLGGAQAPGFDPSGSGPISLDLTAADPVFRDTLAALALGALADDTAFAATPDVQRQMLQRAAQQLFTVNDQLIATQAQTGLREARAEALATRAQSEITALEMSRSAFVDADPFETATRLQDAMTKLDTIYMLTARLSRLSLTEYLR